MENAYAKKEINPIERILDFACLSPLGALALILVCILPLVPPFNKEYLIRWLIMGAIWGTAAISFDLSGGYINIVNFGYMAFFGLGGYTSALVTIHFGLPAWVGIFFGVIPPAVLGFLTGVLSLRLRGMFAICFTWFFGLALMGVTFKWVSLTRGPLGLRVPRLLETTSNVPYFYVVMIMLVVTYIILARLVRSPMGLAFKAIGQNMEAAKTSGINPTRYRIINFTVSCALAGWLGGFYAHYYAILTPEIMHTQKTVEILVVAYIGGRASLWGGVLAGFPSALAMEFIRSTFSHLPGINLLIYGAFLILVMIFYPGGAVQLYRTYIVPSKNRIIQKLVRTRF